MELNERVMALIRENIENKHPVTEQSDLVKDLGIDSFGTLMITNALEDEFKITIDEVDFQTIRTVADIIATLKKKYLAPDKDAP